MSKWRVITRNNHLKARSANINFIAFIRMKSFGKKFPIPIFNLNNYQIMIVGKTQNINVR